MGRPTIRVLAVLELLQAHRSMSGAELARRLDVDRRTVRRYITALEALGIPITAERGSAGGYMLVAGFKLPPLMFTDDEALALAVGLLAARGLGLADAASAAASAQAKLQRVLPAALARRVRAVAETVALDAARHPGTLGDNAALAALSGAAQNRMRVRLRYLTARRVATERDFDPYGLAHRHGCWYVIGMCHLRGGLRSFRLDRVQSVQPLPATFVRPPGFDALAHLAQAMATLPRSFAIEVLLKTDLETAHRQLFPDAGVLEHTAEGVLLRSEADELDWFARQLARLPFPFEILRPAALRSALQAHAVRLQGLAGPSRRRPPRPARTPTERVPSCGRPPSALGATPPAVCAKPAEREEAGAEPWREGNHGALH